MKLDPASTFIPSAEHSIPDIDRLVPKGKPYAAIALFCGAALLVLAFAAAADGLSTAVGFLFGATGIGAVLLGLKLASKQQALRDERTRLALSAVPVDVLIRATMSDAVSEKTRVVVANYLNAHHPGASVEVDGGDHEWRQLKRAGPPAASRCGTGCGKGC